MEIPAWAETLFEKVVVVFETPASDTLEAAGSMDLLPWIDSLLVEIPLLIENVKANVFPASFLTNVMGFSQETLTKLPGLLTTFIIFYLLCGAATVALRFVKGQKSLNSIPRQISNIILTWCCAFFFPLMILLGKATLYVLRSVGPYQGDLVKHLGTAFGESFYFILAFLAVLFTIWMPISSAIRYLQVHKLRGIPHMVLDIGFGPYILAVLLLSAHKGSRGLLLLVLVAAAMLIAVQTGGYISEYYDSQAVHNEAAQRYHEEQAAKSAARARRFAPAEPEQEEPMAPEAETPAEEDPAPKV